MITAEFKDNGVIYSRGEEVTKYNAGDSVMILRDLTESLVQVVITKGESEGMIVSVDKKLLKYTKMEFKLD